MTPPTERLNLSINTISGELQARLDVPTGFIPITDLVPMVRSLGEQAKHWKCPRPFKRARRFPAKRAVEPAASASWFRSLHTEAFALAKMLEDLQQDHRARIEHRLTEIRERLQAAGLLPVLQKWQRSPPQKSDSDVEPINRAYYALRLPCIFLENDACSIYEHRPAACREYLVDTPAEWCQDTEKNGVQELPIPLRAGTVLSIVWARSDGRARPAHAPSGRI